MLERRTRTLPPFATILSKVKGNNQIKSLWFSFEDENTHIKIPLEGPIGNGSLFVHVRCDPSCVVRRAEVEVKETTVLPPEKYKEKRLLIYDYQKHGPRDAKE